MRSSSTAAMRLMAVSSPKYSSSTAEQSSSSAWPSRYRRAIDAPGLAFTTSSHPRRHARLNTMLETNPQALNAAPQCVLRHSERCCQAAAIGDLLASLSLIVLEHQR